MSATRVWIPLIAVALVATAFVLASGGTADADTADRDRPDVGSLAMAAASPGVSSLWVDGSPPAGEGADLRRALAATVRETVSVPSGGTVDQMEYSGQWGVLFARNSATVRVIDIRSEQVISSLTRTPSSGGTFTDISITPDGQYLFALEYGISMSNVHRLEVATGEWDVQQAPIREQIYQQTPDNLEAVSGTEVILIEQDQWVDLTYNGYTPTTGLNPFGQPNGSMVELSRIGSVYSGDIEMDPFGSGIIHHVSTGISSTFITRFQLVDGQLVRLSETISESGYYSGRTVLNGSYEVLFVGPTMVDAEDPSLVYHTFPAPIIAASYLWAFSSTGEAYYIPSRESIGSIGFVPTAIHAAPGWGDVFLAVPGGQEIIHCTAVGDLIGCPTPLICSGQIATVVLQYGEEPTEGDDVIWGTEGDDVIHARGGNDLVCGLGGDDVIVGGDGNDIVYGNSGDDRLIGSIGADYLVGGPGNDSLLGGSGDDRLYGVSGADVIRGDDGNDILWGFSGDDKMFGGNGDDFFAGHAGDDLMLGEGGNDRLFGGRGADELLGGPGSDVVSGGPQNDVVTGGPGDDVLSGNTGNDTLAGQAGNDVLRGGEQDDRLLGGPDVDECNGGPNVDVADADCETQTQIP